MQEVIVCFWFCHYPCGDKDWSCVRPGCHWVLQWAVQGLSALVVRLTVLMGYLNSHYHGRINKNRILFAYGRHWSKHLFFKESQSIWKRHRRGACLTGLFPSLASLKVTAYHTCNSVSGKCRDQYFSPVKDSLELISREKEIQLIYFQEGNNLDWYFEGRQQNIGPDWHYD